MICENTDKEDNAKIPDKNTFFVDIKVVVWSLYETKMFSKKFPFFSEFLGTPSVLAKCLDKLVYKIGVDDTRTSVNKSRPAIYF